MKILALRVRNLASLAGEIEIDFEAQPLAHAGLFAITGPTGAGKSTLLDALCLALYDRLPRLANAPRGEIGRAGDDDRLGGDDVRSVLRHGAAEGFAEVDFQGRDGGRYRARWEVRRARGKANGRLQAQTLSLAELGTGAALGGGKRETLDAIRDKAGLDYDQFRRSVLLAQNEFDAFLKARPAERAELLELMTGTGIYGELSVAAHERCKEERTRLDALEDELARVNVLADDARAALEAEAQRAGDEAVRLAAEAEALAKQEAWYRIEAELAARIRDAETARAESQRDLDAAAPELERLGEVKRALALRPLVAEADRLAAERNRAETEREAAQAELARTRQILDACYSARDHARSREEEAETAFRAAGPDLDRAAELDARIIDGAARVERCRTQLAATRALAGQAEQNVRILEVDHAKLVQKVADIEAWLDRQQARRPLAEQLDRWLDAIAEHARAAADAAQAERLAQAAGIEDVGAALAQAEARVAELAAGLGEVEPLEARRDALAGLDDLLARAEAESRAALALDQRRTELAGRRQAAGARLDEAAAQLAALATGKTGLDAMLAEARRARDLAEAASGEQAELLRERLVADEPCPVCGSREHPVGNVASALTALLDAHRQRVRELEAQAEDIGARRQHELAAQKSAADLLAHSEADLAALAAEAEALAGSRGRALADAARQADALGLAPDRALCEQARAAITAQLKDMRERRAQLDQLARRRDQLRDAARAAADATRARATMARLDELLAGPLAVVPHWRAASADELNATCRRLAEEWQRGTASLEAEREAVRGLSSKLDAARAARDNSARNAESEARTLADEEAGLAGLRQSRAGLFDGRPTAEVRTGLNHARVAAKERHDQAAEALAEAGRAHGVAEARAGAAGQRVGELGAALAAADAARDARLGELALSVENVRGAMALGDAWVAEMEGRLADLRDAQTRALAVLAERQGALAAHESAGRPERLAEAIAALLPDASAARDAAQQNLADLRSKLLDDDRRRGEVEDTSSRVAAQRGRHDLWRGMADLIGSADGSKFRRFAQGLTLDRLLALANSHLAELTPRYALERAPGGDLDLQVRDCDMADEVRGVASLSGGERFLVSLSLALGLASMSGTRVLAESLFIDEGFGALDSDSLDVAISALETLHAAGRKVGVISHVQAMIDRIGVQIRVTKLGGGRSGVEVRAA
jgi:exonuclease SbcC